jgi:alkylhydroperoxidase family enzyme
VIKDPRSLDAPPRARALAGLASLLTEAPWTVDGGDLDRLRDAGVSDEGVVQAVTIAAMFNHLTRVADATAIDFDYATALPRVEIDRAQPPLPRPEPAEWPIPAPRLPLSLRPGTADAIAAWRAYAFAEGDGLSTRDRAVLARTAAFHVCDAAGVAEHGDPPRTAREEALAAFAAKLTVAPWQQKEADLAPLRGLGLSDRGVLHAIAVVGLQNTLSRLRLALG